MDSDDVVLQVDNYMITRFFNCMSLMVILFIFSGCGSKTSNQKEEANAKFNEVDLSLLSDESWEWKDSSSLTYEFSKNDTESSILLSSLIGDFKYIPLINKPNHFIGDIDKVLFTSSLICVMDQYITNTLQCFDKVSGEEIFYLQSSGDGPGEFRDIYDFDIDRENEIVYLFDGRLSKMLLYDFTGNLIKESRVPIRAGNFRRFESGEFIFYTHDMPNEHLGEISSCDFFFLNELLELESCFTVNEKLRGYSDYFARDYFSSDGKRVLLFPKFENHVVEVDPQNNNLNKLFNLKVYGSINDDDLKNKGDDFLEDRKKDLKYFSNGENFVTNEWIGVLYERKRASSFYSFNHIPSNRNVFGNSFEFDVPGMPFFSFPISSYQEEALSVIKLHQIRNLGTDKFLLELEKIGMKTNELELFLSQVEDFDQPAVMIFKFK